jgi:hypothetical protein
MSREVHVRFCEGLRLKCPGLLTHAPVIAFWDSQGKPKLHFAKLQLIRYSPHEVTLTEKSVDEISPPEIEIDAPLGGDADEALADAAHFQQGGGRLDLFFHAGQCPK